MSLRYPTPCGVDQLKFVDGQRPKYKWAGKGGRAHWYGIGQAVTLGGDTLYLVNGPPSVWASTQAGVPATCHCAGEGSVPKPETPRRARRRAAGPRSGRGASAPDLVLCSRLTEVVESRPLAWLVLDANSEMRAVITVAGHRPTVAADFPFTRLLSVIDEVECPTA